MGVRFSAGLLSNEQAAELNRLSPLLDMLNDRVMRQAVPQRDEFPARLTAGEDGRFAWTELEYDRFGQLIEKPASAGGRTGTFAASPAFPMSGSGPSTFPVDVRLRRRLLAVNADATSLGAVYEFDPVGAAETITFATFGSEYPSNSLFIGPGVEFSAVPTDPLSPGKYLIFARLAGQVDAAGGTVSSKVFGRLNVVSGHVDMNPVEYFRLPGVLAVEAPGGQFVASGEVVHLVTVIATAVLNLSILNQSSSGNFYLVTGHLKVVKFG